MKGNIEERCIQLGQYIIEHSATVRAAAKKFDISKSTVHTVVTKMKKGGRQSILAAVLLLQGV